MKKSIVWSLIIILATLIGATVYAQATTAPVNGDDLGAILAAIMDAFKAKNWGILAGLVIMLIVFAVRKFIPKIPANYLPWVSAGLGVLASLATDLVAGGIWYVAIFNGLLVGAAASGLWSLVGKTVLQKN